MKRIPLPKRLGGAIRAQRLALGLTQAQLAEAIQVEKETVSRFETGTLTPTLARLGQIADHLHVPIADLFRAPSDKVADQAESLNEMLSRLPKKEGALIVKLVGDLVALLGKK